MVKCYVEFFDRSDGMPDLRLREKVTQRMVRVVTDQPILQQLAPLSNLLQDCHTHGGALVGPRNTNEFIALSGQIAGQDATEIVVSIDDKFSVKVNILTADVLCAPVSVWCYIEEYPLNDGGLGVRLREKATGRKIEMYGKNKHHLAQFLASPQVTGAYQFMPNLYEKDGFDDYVLVSGGTAVDSYDLLRFNDGDELTYLLGPTTDTAYRDAFRALKEEAVATTYSRTAVSHYESGSYREAILSARLAIEVACGGKGADVKRRLTGAPEDVSNAGRILWDKRNLAVHEASTRVEQQDAEEAIDAMKRLLDFLELDGA